MRRRYSTNNTTQPGGWGGLIILALALAAGYMFNIDWLAMCAGGGLVVWLLMLVFGLLMGARR